MMMGTALRAFAHPTDFLQRLGELNMAFPRNDRGEKSGLRKAPPTTTIVIVIRRHACGGMGIPCQALTAAQGARSTLVQSTRNLPGGFVTITTLKNWSTKVTWILFNFSSLILVLSAAMLLALWLVLETWIYLTASG